MLFTNTFVVAAATYLATGVNAHMKLATPAPFGPDTLNNSPLDAFGSDFPCKQRPGVYAAAKSTATMPIGAKQTLSFIGGATHGGGSCQVSLTSDKEPTKNSEFKVIHSIEGGCPSAAEGNLGNDAGAQDPTTFQYSIPAGIAPGDYTLAWTWFNKVGNREMYMNCAPIVVTGGSAKRDVNSDERELSYNETAEFEIFARDATFPAMFVANIPATDCTTTESTDVQFPDPGASVEKAPSAKLAPPTGPKCGAVKASSGSGSSGDSNAQAASPSAQPSVAPVASPSPADAELPGTATIFADGPTATAEPSAAAAASSGSVLTCSSDGLKFKLVGGPMQAVAAGTKCVGGEIKMASAKRSAKFAKDFQG